MVLGPADTTLMAENCPRCEKQASTLNPISEDVRLFLFDQNSKDALLAEVCSDCSAELERAKTNPELVKNKVNEREMKKLKAWKGRADILKAAVQAGKQGDLLEASKNYSAYLDLLSMMLGVQWQTVTTVQFETTPIRAELGSFILVLFDIVQLYDGKPNAMQEAAVKQLLQFAPKTRFAIAITEKCKKLEKDGVDKTLFKKLRKEISGDKGWFW